MKHFFTPTFALAGLLCAFSGAALSGCNRGSGGTSTLSGATSGAPSDTLATVGTSKVTRADLNTFLEAQYGENTLPALIDTQLVFEALKAKNLEVSDADVEADLARRQKDNPQVAELIAAGGPRLNIIKTQLKRELAIQKLLTADIKPTDAQVKSFFEKNRAYYDTPAKVKVGLLFTSTKARADLLANQLKSKTKSFAQLVADQKKVNDPIAGQSTDERPTFEGLDSFPPAVRAQLLKLPKGGTTSPQSLNIGLPTPVFVIFRKTDEQVSKKADLTKIRPEVELDYKFAQVAEKTAAKNPQNPKNFAETVKRTFDAIKIGSQETPPNPNATLRDALNAINQYAANELLGGLRTGGTVQIDDATYAKVAAPYQAANAAGNTASGNVASGNTASGNVASGNAASENAATGNTATENAATANAAPAANAAP